MPESACWKGAPFWHELNDRNCRFEKLQALLSRRNIFDSNANPGLNVVQPGDVIPVPYIPMDELSLHVPPEDTPADSETNSCRPAKTTVELLSLEACSTPPPSSPQTPLDRRIAELEATIALDGASRLAASPRTIANLRPEPQLQTSSLIKETGITRLPNEITKRIVNSVEHRRDISALSCVSKRWRVDTMSALYSILILRGWDEVILCLRTVYSVKDIANYINDLTIDVAHLPESLNEMFYVTLENALDKTRNLRRLAIIMDNNRVRISRFSSPGFSC
ncbi:hypothetical protein FRC12_002383 [Ceratobasidium sp. 428]|nr:hypothetical protein FRC12_002383 [Ceratobasidium sp. 428]